MDKQDIILMYIRDQKSKRSIARETGFARKTVDKYINEYEKQLVELGIDPQDKIKRQELIKELTDKPMYKSLTYGQLLSILLKKFHYNLHFKPLWN